MIRITDEVIRQFVLSATSEIHYAGQNIITQDKYEDTFFVIRRGRAEILVDDEVVGSAGAMDPLGELALMYGTRRAMTVRCAGPCEVFVLDRASYDTGIATLEPGEREGPLVVIMHQVSHFLIYQSPACFTGRSQSLLLCSSGSLCPDRTGASNRKWTTRCI